MTARCVGRPATETLTVFPAPLNFPGFLNSVDTDSEGRVWFNAHYGSARLDPVTKKWEMFQQRTPFDGFSYGMAVDADDNPWWSVWNADTVFTADLKTGEITEIPMRDPGVRCAEGAGHAGRSGILRIHRVSILGREFDQPGLVRERPAPVVGRQTRPDGVGAKLGRDEHRRNRHPHEEGDLSPIAGEQPCLQDRRGRAAQCLGVALGRRQPGQVRPQHQQLDGVSVRQPRVRAPTRMG